MNIEIIDIDRLSPYAGNPRINDMAIDAVAASLKEFGFRQPIVCDDKLSIIVGHTRYKAALRLGLSEVPVHIANDLSEMQKKAYRIADNRLNEIADWDYSLLSTELDDLRLGDYDLDIIKFSEKELQTISGMMDTKASSPQEYDESASDDIKKIECPGCGLIFPVG